MLLLYSIYDTQVGVFAPPFTVTHEMLAIRAFVDIATDGNSMIAKHPAAFNLFYLGQFVPKDGSFQPEQIPKNLGSAASYIANKGAANG